MRLRRPLLLATALLVLASPAGASDDPAPRSSTGAVAEEIAAAAGGSLRVGRNARRIQWPELGHKLRENPRVRRQAADFIASAGRERPQAPRENNP